MSEERAKTKVTAVRTMAALAALCTTAAAAIAQTPPSAKSYILSAPLVEELFQRLATEPYANVAPLIAKLQAEVQHQPAPENATKPDPSSMSQTRP